MAGSELVWQVEADGYTFRWDILQDVAEVRRGTEPPLWHGSFLPLFEIGQAGMRRAVVPVVDPAHSRVMSHGGAIAFSLDGLGTGEILVQAGAGCVRIERLTVRWRQDPPVVVALLFGAKPLTPEQADLVPDLSKPYWPDWQCEGYCVPAVKGGPEQSFFRRWELGNATLPLGSFGPSLGTPYAAAYPRPLFSAGFGNARGWVIIGCGDVPDGAMLLQIRSSCAMLEYRYREDLWGPLPGRERTWEQPLRLTWAEVAWDAFDRLFATFDVGGAVSPHHQASIWNTWGDFRHGRFDLRRIIDTAHAMTAAELICIDERWETFDSSGIIDTATFPSFHDDRAHAGSLGMSVGFWQAAGWIDDPAAFGLGDDDLLLGIDGRPRRTNWGMNPHERAHGHLNLDPSSPRTQAFLRERTRRVVSDLGASLLKLDFAYGLPGPDVSTPRDPALRGERLPMALLQLIADAARAANPKITIEGFSIHPLMRRVADLCSLDDLGDAGGAVDARYEIDGHAQWSIWSALAGPRGTAINASSGYNAEAEIDILMNTLVIGAPGAMLPMSDYDESPAGQARRRLRIALSRWRRRSTQWRPLWLDSEPGRLGLEPCLRSWGRLETFSDRHCLTALALRSPASRLDLLRPLGVESFTGRWGLVAQDDAAVDQSAHLALIPFAAGELSLRLARPPRRITAVYLDRERPLASAQIHGNQVVLGVDSPAMIRLLGIVVV